MSKESNQKYPSPPPEYIKSYLKSSEDCISLINKEGFFYYCNPAHKKVFGYGATEIEGLHFSAVPFFQKDQYKEFTTLFQELLSGKKSAIVRTSALKKGGNKIFVETSITSLLDDDELHGFLTISREITDRIVYEQQLKTSANNIENLLEGMADPLILHRLTEDKKPGKIILCNQKALEITGYSLEEMLQMSILDFGYPDSGLEDKSLFDDIISGTPVLFERIIVRKDKTVFPVEVHAQLVDYQDEIMVLSMLRDITRRRKEEEETQLHLMFEQIVSKISSRFVNLSDHLIDKGIERTLKEVSEFIGAIRGRVFLYNDNGKNLIISHEWCEDKKFSQKQNSQKFNPESFPYFQKKLSKLEDVVIDSLGDLPKTASVEKEWFDKNGFYPIFYVPIISEDKVAGVLGFTANDSQNHVWQRQYGYLLRYISTVIYNAISRKEINQKLRLTQFSLDNYSDSVFWMTSPEYKVIDVNPAVCKTLGYRKEEMLEMTVFDFDIRFGKQDLKKRANELKTKGRMTLESIHRKKDGTVFPVEIVANLIDFEGNVYIVAFARDITARKEAEEQILKSEQEYRKIFENVAHVFYEASLDGKLVSVTPSVERLTNYKPDEIIGKSMEIFYHDPASREVLLKLLYEKGEAVDHELEVRDVDGSPVPVNLNARIIFDQEGNPAYIVGSLSDLRERRKAERQVRQLSTALEQSPVSVIITDPDTHILYVNNSFSLFSGMKPEEIIGTTPFEITRGQLSINDYNDLWDSVKKGNIWKGEIEYTKRGGEKVWLSITVSPILDENNEPTNFVAIIEEITERKAAEQDLRKAKEQAEKSDHLKSAFLANMSHEIRTPMNAILGFSSLLKEGDLDQEQSDYYIDIINSKGRDLLRIISDIIDISRIEAGDLYIKMEPVEIFPFVRDVFNEFKEDTQTKSRRNLQFRLNIPENEKKVIVNTDPARLKQVFVNLIQNALKFTHDGFVEVGFLLKENNDISFTVKDSGIGIPEDKKKIIFERFRQIDDSHTREYGGTGLGLAICKNLLDLMGSKLELKSHEGQGSEFTFGMKYILTDSRDLIMEAEESTVLKIDLDLKGKKILIVEDDGSSYLFLETFLNRYSPEIIWAKTGKQAVDMLNQNKGIDIVLMDIRMPEMDGLSATREIRKTNKVVPIIAQTAYAQVTDRKLALESGCNDYLSKPVSPVELTDLLAKYLNP